MKKITFLFAIAMALIFTSCSKDEKISLPNSIDYAGKEIPITNAIIEDYDAFDGYYNYDFTFDGTSDNVSYRFYAELFSPVVEGVNGFRTGVFTYATSQPTTEPAFYFESANITVNGQTYSVSGGKITVSGSGTDYSFTTDVVLANGESVEVRYDGEFILL